MYRVAAIVTVALAGHLHTLVFVLVLRLSKELSTTGSGPINPSKAVNEWQPYTNLIFFNPQIIIHSESLNIPAAISAVP
jgi:hypothetical protein